MTVITNHTLGTKTNHNVPVVQTIMKTEISRKLAFCCSLSTAEIATPNTHMMVTLYTDIPLMLGFEHFEFPMKEMHQQAEIL